MIVDTQDQWMRNLLSESRTPLAIVMCLIELRAIAEHFGTSERIGTTRVGFGRVASNSWLTISYQTR
jgi:hypothetical protein